MSPRDGVLAGAAVSGWAALLLLATTADDTGSTAVVAGAVGALAVPLLWAPHRALPAIVPLLVGLLCVVLGATGTSPFAAAAVGVLLLVHVLLADLAADAVGSSARAVRAALAELAPAVAVGTVAAVVLAVVVGTLPVLPAPVGTALRTAAPFLVLAAAVLALGLASRRPSWDWVPQRAGLSALTRRYVDRLARER
jgi:hypothetical protein